MTRPEDGFERMTGVHEARRKKDDAGNTPRTRGNGQEADSKSGQTNAGGQGDEQPSLLHWLGNEPPAAPPMAVDGILPQIGLAILAGQHGTGKTFVAANLAASLITGSPFMGASVLRKGGVLWFAAEGRNEIDARAKAALGAVEAGVPYSKRPFAYQERNVPCLKEASAFAQLTAYTNEAAAIMQERFGTGLALIVIDTLAASAGFADENAAAETQAVLNTLRRLADHTGAIVLAIDHFGKLVETGVRGSSAKMAAADAIIAILAPREISGRIPGRSAAIYKLRCGRSGDVFPFSLKEVPIDGATTCVVDWELPVFGSQDRAKEDRKAWTKALRPFKHALEVALIDHGKLIQPWGAQGPSVKAADKESVRNEFYASYPAENKEAKRKKFSRSIESAISSGLVAARCVEIDGAGIDWLWLVSEDGPLAPGGHGNAYAENGEAKGTSGTSGTNVPDVLDDP
jgi:AAA domain